METGKADTSLLRFLNKTTGPIVRISTTILGSKNEFSYSFAELAPSIRNGFRELDTLGFGGSAWDQDRFASQERAIAEAIERWAFKSYLDDNFAEARLDLDPTTNGFSALPSKIPIRFAYRHAYSECVERFLLSEFADNKVFKLLALDLVCAEMALFDPTKGSLVSYHTSIVPNDAKGGFENDENIHFVVSLFWIKNAGLVVGSAAGDSLKIAHKKSLRELFIHWKASERVKDIEIPEKASITDKRLKNFAESPQLALILLGRIDACSRALDIPKIPSVIFCQELPGPWNPEFNVVRILLEGVQPLTAGDKWRFLI